MPVLGGWDTARQLRANGHRDCKIIILSADATKANQSRRDDDAHDDFLPKPFDLSLLLERIGTLLQIDWVHASGSNPIPPREKTSITDVLEPAAVMELLHLARIGYTKGFLRRLAQIKEDNTATIAAINLLKALASELKFDEIANLLETSGGDTAVGENA